MLVSRLESGDAPLPSAFTEAVSQLKLPPHSRLLRLQPPGWFYVIYPRLCLRLLLLKREVRNAFLTETRGRAHMELGRRCQEILTATEQVLGRSSWIGHMVDRWAMWSDDCVLWLRKVLIATTAKSAARAQKYEQRKPVDMRLAAIWITALPLAAIALLAGAYGTFHFLRCTTVDCVTVGAWQLALTAAALGLAPVRHCWSRVGAR
jgi:hypothetical protein